MKVSPIGLTLLLGGARSGKSDLATRLGESWPGDVAFVATAEALDDDMESRIKRHRDDRPSHWNVLEAPLVNAGDIATIAADQLVIVDCLTMLTSNLMFAQRDEPAILDHVESLGRALRARPAPSLVISNEVGMGIHPATELGRDYRDLLGRVNRAVAALADAALLIIAGRAIELQEINATWS